jgi:hypothetical protein
VGVAAAVVLGWPREDASAAESALAQTYHNAFGSSGLSIRGALGWMVFWGVVLAAAGLLVSYILIGLSVIEDD